MIKDLADNKQKEVTLIHDNKGYIFFLCVHGTFIKTNHIVNHNKNLNKFQTKLYRTHCHAFPHPSEKPHLK